MNKIDYGVYGDLTIIYPKDMFYLLKGRNLAHVAQLRLDKAAAPSTVLGVSATWELEAYRFKGLGASGTARVHSKHEGQGGDLIGKSMISLTFEIQFLLVHRKLF